MIILSYITFALLAVFGLFIYLINTYFRIYQEEVYNNRFIVVKTALDVFPQNEDEDSEFSEDLRKLMGKSAPQRLVKRVQTETVIDLEEIIMMTEWTTSNYEDENILSNCTMVTFRTGDQLLVMDKLENMEIVLAAYQELKSFKKIKK